LGLLENRPSQQWILPIRLIGIWLRRRGMKEIAAYNDLQVRRHNWDNEKNSIHRFRNLEVSPGPRGTGCYRTVTMEQAGPRYGCPEKQIT
jgi:hypothetical protein